MREYTPENITDAVLEQMATTPDPRMKEIMESAVRHLHAFARDVNLTPARMDQGHRVHDQGRPDVHAGAPGVHPAVRHGGPFRAGQHHARQDQDGGGDRRQPARAVLPREHAAASRAARRSPRTARAGDRGRAVRPRHQCPGRADTQRAGHGVADGGGRPLRHPEQHRGDRLPRHLPHRRQGQLPDPHGAAAGLLHPARRPRRARW